MDVEQEFCKERAGPLAHAARAYMLSSAWQII